MNFEIYVLSLDLSVYIFVCLSSVYLYIYLSNYLYIHVTLYLSIYLFAYLSASGGQSKCTNCPAGNQCPITTQAITQICSDGTYSVGSQSLCTSCPAGKACDIFGESSNKEIKGHCIIFYCIIFNEMKLFYESIFFLFLSFLCVHCLIFSTFS